MTPDCALAFEGVVQPISEWALDYGIPASLIIRRLHDGASVEWAITEPMPTRPGQRLGSPSQAGRTTPRKIGAQPVERVRSGPQPRLYTHNGKTRTMAEWSAAVGIGKSAIRKRLRDGMTFAEAIETPPLRQVANATYDVNGVSKTYREWAEHAGIKYKTLIARIAEGYPLAEAIAAPLRRWPGVVSNLDGCQGTGAGSIAQEIPQIDFPTSEVSE